MTTYAIGDVQGCFDELQALLDKINYDPVLDILWFTGDLVNRGPKSLETLRFVKSLGNKAITVLGNHDLHLLAVMFSKMAMKPEDTLNAILQADDGEELCHWLRQQPLLHHDKNFVLVHAGIYPKWSLDQAIRYAKEVEATLAGENYNYFLNNMYGNSPNRWDENLQGMDRLRFITNVYTRMRFCGSDAKLELSDKGHPTDSDFIPWFDIKSNYDPSLKILFGHWAALEGKTPHPNLYPLDTGCAWGKCLTAFCLEYENFISIKC